MTYRLGCNSGGTSSSICHIMLASAMRLCRVRAHALYDWIFIGINLMVEVVPPYPQLRSKSLALWIVSFPGCSGHWCKRTKIGLRGTLREPLACHFRENHSRLAIIAKVIYVPLTHQSKLAIANVGIFVTGVWWRRTGYITSAIANRWYLSRVPYFVGVD